MFQTDVAGLPSGARNEYGDVSYHLAFDGLPYRDKDGRTRRIPFSTGFGGNHWILLPNWIYRIDTMIDVAKSIRPFE
jgi:hypothetical protein